MTQARGSVKQNEETLLESIEVWIFEFEDSRSGLTSWSGRFTLPQGTSIEPGGPYRLVLDDGRSGDILVTSSVISSHLPTDVQFKGSGSLR